MCYIQQLSTVTVSNNNKILQQNNAYHNYEVHVSEVLFTKTLEQRNAYIANGQSTNPVFQRFQAKLSLHMTTKWHFSKYQQKKTYIKWQPKNSYGYRMETTLLQYFFVIKMQYLQMTGFTSLGRLI